jgi:gamma-glutamyltranspeptidase/glutathione hydrolase
LHGSYRGYEIAAVPPPSSGGVHIIELLNVLEGFPLASLGANSAATIHLMAEAMKLAYADRAEYLGDPDQVAIPVHGLISKAYAERLRAEISHTRARPASEIKPLDPAPYERQTTHFQSSITTATRSPTPTRIFLWPRPCRRGTGILLNNELDVSPQSPGLDAYSLVGGAANRRGAQACLSSIAPTMVSKRRTQTCHQLARRFAGHHDRRKSFPTLSISA